MTFLVHIGRDTYVVQADNVVNIQNRILDAVHAGGAFVAMPHAYGHTSLVLITPASAVRIDESAPVVPAHDDNDVFSDLAFLELDG